MKKICISLVLLLSILLITTGCDKNEANSSGTNTSTGTNTNNSSSGESYTPSELSKNITSSGAMTALDKLVVFAKNNNKVPVDMEIEVEFYDKNGTIVGSDSDSLIGVGANSEIATEMWSTPDSFDNYKIYVDVEQTDEKSYLDKVELTHNNTNKEIAVQVKNNSGDTIESVSVSVVYYKDDKVVGIEDGYESDIKPGRSANFNIDYPYNKNYDKIRFDTYKVFVTEAYSFDW